MRRRGAETNRASYTMEVQGQFILLEDRDRGRSVTNDAERVVADLAARGVLSARRVLYKDSTGRWDELTHDGARFTGFAPNGGHSRAEALARARSGERSGGREHSGRDGRAVGQELDGEAFGDRER